MSKEEMGYKDHYAETGVDTKAESLGMKGFLNRIRDTFAFTKGKQGEVMLDLGYYASVIRIHNGERDIGIALSADGVGTKVLIAQMMNRYDSIGIDCVAMNVNDLICVGAKPLAMLNYLALQRIDESILNQIAEGLYKGVREAGISIPGGETAQVKDLLQGYEEGKGFDLAGMAMGIVDLDRIITGRDIKPGDLVFGLSSNGLHSNGFSLAREVLLKQTGWGIDHYVPELGKTIGEELICPTKIYVPQVLELIENIKGIKALCHITGDGLLNVLRVDASVAIIIDHIPQPPPIFQLIQERGGISDKEMFQVYNMGIGFCIICSPEDMHNLNKICEGYDLQAYRIGYTIESLEKYLEITPYNLRGQGRVFCEL